MKTLNLFLVLTLTFLSLFLNAQQQLKTNEFVVGISYSNLSMFTDTQVVQMDIPYDKYNILSDTNTTYLNYPTSPLNQLSLDGFNVVHYIQPSSWSHSEKRMESLIRLVKNNGIKIAPFVSEWFVPLSELHNDNGFNCYDNDISGYPLYMENHEDFHNRYANKKARPDHDYLFNNVYNKTDLKDHIWGYCMGGEYNCLHGFVPDSTPNNGEDGYISREIPTFLADSAIGHFKNLAQTGQKVAISIVNHGRSIHSNTDDCNYDNGVEWELSPIDIDPQDYLYLNNKPDVLIEESYYLFPRDNWWTFPYSNIDNNGYDCSSHSVSPCNMHYLAKFKNIDYLKTKCKEVHASATAERYDPKRPNETDIYLPHYVSTNILNANWLWFQAYTSIIHGVKGFWIFGHNMCTQQEKLQFNGNNAIHISDTSLLSPQNYWKDDRYTLQYFDSHYQNFVRHLGRELAYLQRKEFLSTDDNTILYTKTDEADDNCIVPAFSAYIPTYFPNGYGPSPANGTVSIVNNYPELRSEHYGLRYTMRTNGSDVIMIVSNPLNIPITATLDFNNVANSVVRSSTGVKILFEDSLPTYNHVSSSSYKTTRDASINLENLAIEPTSYSINYSSPTNKQITLSFGPMDVHVIKFVAGSLVNEENGWTNIWTNFGSGHIDGWGVQSIDKFYAGDFDGDGSEELFCIQGTSSNAWAALFKYQNNDWDCLWSNYGNGRINSLNQGWAIKTGDLFYIGDFEYAGKDELLCVQTLPDGYYAAILKYNNGNWEWIWANDCNATSLPLCGYRLNFAVGDYNNDNREEVLGVNGDTIKMFRYNSGTWSPIWSNNGNTSHMMYSYRNNLKAGNFNGTGQDDILGMADSATVFYFDGEGSWSKGESTNGASSMGSWTYPPNSTDLCLIGDVDTYDTKDEIFWLQTGSGATYATTMDAGSGTFSYGWSNWGYPAYIDDWPLGDGNGGDTRYLLIKADSSDLEYLLAIREYGCDNYIVSMYKTNNSSDKSALMPTRERNSIDQGNVLVFPNPSKGIIMVKSKNMDIDKIEIFNKLGQVIFIGNYSAQKSVKVDISKELNGIYFIKATSSNGLTVIQKLVLNH